MYLQFVVVSNMKKNLFNLTVKLHSVEDETSKTFYSEIQHIEKLMML